MACKSAAPAVRVEIPEPAEFMNYVDRSVDALFSRIQKAGDSYGEDVLFNLGEMGAVTFVYAKAARLLWSFEHKQPASRRQDSWMDIAGYAILEMARQLYIADKTGQPLPFWATESSAICNGRGEK